MHTATHLVCRVPCGTHGKCYGIVAAVMFSSVCRVSCTQHTAKPGICRVYYFAVCFLTKHTANRLICRVCFVCRVPVFLLTANVRHTANQRFPVVRCPLPALILLARCGCKSSEGTATASRREPIRINGGSSVYKSISNRLLIFILKIYPLSVTNTIKI